MGDVPAIVVLNVGGQRFTTSRQTLQNSSSMFAKMFSGMMDSRRDETGAYFVDRDPKHFPVVLNYLRDGTLAELPPSRREQQELLQEARFYLLEGLEQLLVTHAERTKQSMWLSLTQNATLQQLVHVLLAVAFCPPYEPYQLTGRTTVRVTVSPETVEFRGPHKSVSAQSGLGQERYDAMSAMAAYLCRELSMAQLVLGEQGYDLQPQASALPDPNRLRAYYFEVKLALPGGTQGLPPVQFGSADAAGAGGGTIGGGTPMGIQIDSRTGPRSFA